MAYTYFLQKNKDKSTKTISKQEYTKLEQNLIKLILAKVPGNGAKNLVADFPIAQVHALSYQVITHQSEVDPTET